MVTKPGTGVTSTDTWVHVKWKLDADHENIPVANQKWTMKIYLMWELAEDDANTLVAPVPTLARRRCGKRRGV